jgi:hypothetical protein
MKKSILSLMAFSVVAMTIVGCKKDKDEAVASTTGTATVEGYIKANLNMRNDTLPNGAVMIMNEGIPTSVTLTFVVNSKDLEKNPDPMYVYDMVKTTTTVDGSGHYSVSLPTPMSANTILGTMNISDFDYKPIITSSTNTDSTAARVTYTAAAQGFSIYNGGTTIVDYTY